MSSKIDKFLAKPEKCTIMGEEYELMPFTIDDLPLLTRLGSKEEVIASNATKEVILKVLKQIDKDAKEEHLRNVSLEYLEEIMKAVTKINNLPDEMASQEALGKLKARNESR